MLDKMPIAVMTCDLDNFTINYANEATIESLKVIEGSLPCKAEDIVGQSIDIFHKNPEHQRQLLANPANLPHKAVIQFGDEVLDLNITPLFDGGLYVGPMLSWSVITEQHKAEKETQKLLQMLDNMPVNVMMVDVDTFDVSYANKTSLDTLRPLQHLLSIKVDELIGSSIDVFHKHPEHQRAILSDPSRLPFHAQIKLGEETLDLGVSAIYDAHGNYIAPMLNWTVITAEVQLAADLQNASDQLKAAAGSMNDRSSSLAAASEETSAQTSSVATAIEQLSASIAEIAGNVTQSAMISKEAVTEAETAGTSLASMADATDKINSVVTLIQEIADQTNLLALNATIEAARAGEAGRGFAVVAAEVKELASQTAKATKEISQQIGEIQGAASSSVAGVRSIIDTINKLAEMSTTVSAAVEKQTAASQEVVSNISGVSEAATDSGNIALAFKSDSEALADQAAILNEKVEDFLSVNRA